MLEFFTNTYIYAMPEFFIDGLWVTKEEFYPLAQTSMEVCLSNASALLDQLKTFLPNTDIRVNCVEVSTAVAQIQLGAEYTDPGI
jgi:hypothetical protein